MTKHIRSDLTISGNVEIKGGITNTELNNNTDAITTISGLVNTHTTNITTISGLVNTNTTNITTISGLVNTNTTNITTISGLVNTISGTLNNLTNGITLTANAFGGYDINIGDALSRVYINGDLYYNNDLMLRRDFSDGNQIGFTEYITQTI